MKVVCYQLAAAPGTLRLWIGAHPATTVPQVDGWRIDGADVRPANLVVVRRMQSVRQGRLPPGDRPRAFSGVYDITGVAGPAYPKLEVRVDGRLFERTLRSLPRRLEIDGPGLNVLLVSCFHYSTDGGLYGELLPRIVRGAAAADLCVFMGDQVYLDLPTLQNFPDDPGWLADKFEQDYVRNWFFGSFAGGLQLAPMAFVPDDHEYWNNFPHPSPFIQNSLSGSGRDNWGAAARGCFEGFQLGHGGLGAALDFDVEPVSFLMLDSRSWRNAELTRLLSDEASTQLNAWADRVAGSSGLIAGVIVTGQSLIEKLLDSLHHPSGGVLGVRIPLPPPFPQLDLERVAVLLVDLGHGLLGGSHRRAADVAPSVRLQRAPDGRRQALELEPPAVDLAYRLDARRLDDGGLVRLVAESLRHRDVLELAADRARGVARAGGQQRPHGERGEELSQSHGPHPNKRSANWPRNTTLDQPWML
jgi:hypothetical protein